MGAERKACFAGGCFWCIAPAFSALPGVKEVVCGYSGGSEKAPSYADVKAQRTGHRECVRVTYDPETVSYGQLIDAFLSSVDPFDGGGQFIDRGRSYTLAVYVNGEEEKEAVQKKIRALEQDAERTDGCPKKAQIAVEPFLFFAEAEDEHQDYAVRHPEAFAREWTESGRADYFREGGS